MPFLLVTNPSGADDLPGRVVRELDDACVLTLDGSIDLRAEITSAIAEGRVVVACGVDGTVNAVVQHLAGTDGVLGVLPGGTQNHFARDLGVEDPSVAIETLRSGTATRVDVALGGERVFVNNLGHGLYPELPMPLSRSRRDARSRQRD